MEHSRSEGAEYSAEQEQLRMIDEVESSADPVLEVQLMRHGPKASAAGEKNKLAENFVAAVQGAVEREGIDVAPDQPTHLSASPIQRAVDTRDVVAGSLHEKTGRTFQARRTNPALATPLAPDHPVERTRHDFAVLIQIQKVLEPLVRQRLEGMEFADEEAREAAVREGLDREILTHIFAGDASAYITELNREHGTQIPTDFSLTAEDLATPLARRLNGFRRHLGDLSYFRTMRKKGSSTPYVQIDISHSYPTMAFLRQHLVFREGSHLRLAANLSAEEFFERVGGVVPETGLIRLSYRKHEGRSLVSVAGRGFSGYVFLEDV